LKKVGTWAADNPGLFAGIVAGLALAPAVITGISSIASLVGLMTGATVSGTLLAALGYVVAIGGTAYVAAKVGDAAVDKGQKYTGMGTDPRAMTDMSGQTLLNRLPQKAFADLTGTDAPWEDPTNPNSPAHFAMIEQIKMDARDGKTITGGTGMISAAEDRRGWFLQWWDATWG